MIRLTAMLRRNPALSAEEFQRHWRDVHGPLIASVPGIERWVVRYEQHPRAMAPGQWTGSEGFDGVTVQWFRSVDDLMAMIADPIYRAVVGPDERHLVDLESSVFLLTDEPRVVIGGPDPEEPATSRAGTRKLATGGRSPFPQPLPGGRDLLTDATAIGPPTST